MNTSDLFLNAHWIESDLVGSPHAGSTAPVFCKTFTLDQDVHEAVLHWTCIGIAEVTLDGKPVHDGVFLPGWTDFKKRLRVLRIELGTLSAGGHSLKATVGDGWAVGHIANHPRQVYSDRVRFLAELRWKDGGIATDDSWKTFASSILQNDLLMGETV
ncbi:MAG: alpha-L-rhamnosidase N-terminal domain-containing protein, partial [Kiritimatiellae bacterium]|nr:alpha-L-rhamnosidase N-terminal domain-containing protein [Kiritimatiellia bacterium]